MARIQVVAFLVVLVLTPAVLARCPDGYGGRECQTKCPDACRSCDGYGVCHACAYPHAYENLLTGNCH
jgi:hypothetical protein